MLISIKKIKIYIHLFLTVFSGTLLTLSITNWINEVQRKEQEAVLRQQIDRATINLQRNFDRYTDNLYSTKDYSMASSSKINREQFRVVTDRTSSQNRGIRALEWVPQISQKNRKEFEQSAKAEWFVAFQITEVVNGKLVSAGDRPF